MCNWSIIKGNVGFLDQCVRYVEQGLLTDDHYKDRIVDRAIIKRSMQVYIDHPRHLFLAVVDDGQFVDDKLVGCLFAYTIDSWFSKHKEAYDLIHYIEPKYRSYKLTKSLIDKYVKWSKDQRCDDIYITNTYGMQQDRMIKLYKRLHFNKIGNVFRLC